MTRIMRIKMAIMVIIITMILRIPITDKMNPRKSSLQTRPGGFPMNNAHCRTGTENDVGFFSPDSLKTLRIPRNYSALPQFSAPQKSGAAAAAGSLEGSRERWGTAPQLPGS